MGKREIIENVKEFKKSAEKKFALERVFIFGSAARGKMKKDSDVDLLLVSNKFKGKKFFKRAIGLRAHWKLDCPVDFLCYTPKEFDKLRKMVTIVREAVKEGIEIN
ncbi:MAG: nucleotidyltransferase domain-containing protein [Candidatus Aenigmarchaeota archaeon]|nr:nucleotidyltransferase domain-containing protein [Candidatus Aenigmarchaeota archaeon]